MGGTSPEETRGGQGLCGQTIYLPLISLVSGEGVTTDSCNLVFNISVAPASNRLVFTQTRGALRRQCNYRGTPMYNVPFSFTLGIHPHIYDFTIMIF